MHLTNIVECFIVGQLYQTRQQYKARRFLILDGRPNNIKYETQKKLTNGL